MKKRQTIIERIYNHLHDQRDDRDFFFAAPGSLLKALPKNVDLRHRCPSVYDQSKLGSCGPNAGSAAHEFDQITQDEQAFTPSRLFLYRNVRVEMGTVNQDSGVQIRDVMKSLANQGVCPETMWPYDITKFRDLPPKPCFDEAMNHQAVTYYRVLQLLPQLKGCLAAGFPFVFGFQVYESFESAAVAKTGKMPMPKLGEQCLGGHAVMAVGYDEKKKVFIVRNSWGAGWGDGGYFYMPYLYMIDPRRCSDFWTIRLVE